MWRRSIETAVRAQKDIAISAKASGDDVMRRECQRNTNRLDAQYGRIGEKAGLLEKRERMSVSEFRRVKTTAEIASTRLSKTVTVDEIHVFATLHVMERMEQRGVTIESAIDSLTNPSLSVESE